MRRLSVLVALAYCALVAVPDAGAEKLKGHIWDVTPLVVEGIEVILDDSTKIERKKHPNIVPGELRVGWKVEVEGEVDGHRLLAEKIKVKTERHQKTEVEGFIDAVGEEVFEVEGRRIRWSGIDRSEIRPGMMFEGKGILVDDGTMEIREFRVEPRRFEDDEAEFLALAASELDELKKNLDFYEDRLFQEYVARVGHSLVPRWIDRNELRFSFGIVNDPDLNAFALPDGTIVIHTGLLATLENEAQLATVLGHEIAHVVHKHGYRGYKRGQKLKWFALGAAVAGAAIDADRASWEGPSWTSTLVQLGATLSLTAAVNGHGRNMEDDADRIGLGYAIGAGYDPMEAPRVWYLFAQHTEDRNEVANWFFSDHSTHRARIGNLTQEINRYHRDALDPESLLRNEREYARMVARLRRANAILDYERREYGNARTALERLLDANPEDPVAHLYVGKLVWDTQGMDGAEEALGELDRASEIDPAYAEPFREKGFIYYSLGYRESAIEAFRRYVDLAPHADDAAEIRGYIRDLSG